MKPKQSFVRRLTFAGARGLAWGVLGTALAVGCAEPAAEEAPQDIEQARQEHISTTQRELGQSSSQP